MSKTQRCATTGFIVFARSSRLPASPHSRNARQGGAAESPCRADYRHWGGPRVRACPRLPAGRSLRVLRSALLSLKFGRRISVPCGLLERSRQARRADKIYNQRAAGPEARCRAAPVLSARRQAGPDQASALCPRASVQARQQELTQAQLSVTESPEFSHSMAIVLAYWDD